MSNFGRLCCEAAQGERIWRNEYVCPDCADTWEDDWSVQCDDDCANCGKRHISPASSSDVTGEYIDDEPCTEPVARAA